MVASKKPAAAPIPDSGGGGDWLFKQGELVLGPIPARQLIDKLYRGELTGKSEISAVGQGRFRRLAEVETFKLHVAKAEAKLRVDALAQAEQARGRRRRNILIGFVGATAVIVAGLSAVGARYLAVHNPFKSGEELAFADIVVEPPTIAVAKARSPDEELLDYPAGGGGGGGSTPRKAPERAAPERSHASAERAATERPARASKASESQEPDGLAVATTDWSAINAVVASKKVSLNVCFIEEAQRHPGFAAKIPLEFMVGNDGRVSKLWVDNPAYKQGPLADCLLRELQKWPFKPYQGEQASVRLPFTIGKPR